MKKMHLHVSLLLCFLFILPLVSALSMGAYAAADGEYSFEWTTVYNANGGTGDIKPTYHGGAASNLANNTFTRSGYTFAGWYLSRESDGKWLYRHYDGVYVWNSKGEQPVNASLALYGDGQAVSNLTECDGDTVTCYAQWTPNSTGATTFYIQYDANGGTGTMADTKVVRGVTTQIRKNTFTREGYVFAGWTAFRRSDMKFAYKTVSNGTFTEQWVSPSEPVSANCFLKVYSDGCGVSATSSTDRDIITFYAAWARVREPVMPIVLAQGQPFAFGGTVECNGGIYQTVVALTDEEGTPLGTHTATVCSNTYDLSSSNDRLPTGSLPTGTYIYTVDIKTVNGATPRTCRVFSASFSVTSVIAPEPKIRFEHSITGRQFDAMYNAAFMYVGGDGSVVSEDSLLGTGTFAFYGEYCSALVIVSDIDGDGAHTANDLLILKSYFKGHAEIDGLYYEAADANDNGSLTVTDYIKLKRKLTS